MAAKVSLTQRSGRGASRARHGDGDETPAGAWRAGGAHGGHLESDGLEHPGGGENPGAAGAEALRGRWRRLAGAFRSLTGASPSLARTLVDPSTRDDGVLNPRRSDRSSHRFSREIIFAPPSKQ